MSSSRWQTQTLLSGIFGGFLFNALSGLCFCFPSYNFSLSIVGSGLVFYEFSRYVSVFDSAPACVSCAFPVCFYLIFINYCYLLLLLFFRCII